MSKRFIIVIAILLFGGMELFSQSTTFSFKRIGVSSYYSTKFHNKITASGERFDMYDFTAAHPTLAFGTRLKVTNMKNDKYTIVRVNDRGPFSRGRMLDISYAAAVEIDMVRTGTAKVKIEVITESEEENLGSAKEIAANLDKDN
jgi:rare lipoprotein A